MLGLPQLPLVLKVYVKHCADWEHSQEKSEQKCDRRRKLHRKPNMEEAKHLWQFNEEDKRYKDDVCVCH